MKTTMRTAVSRRVEVRSLRSMAVIALNALAIGCARQLHAGSAGYLTDGGPVPLRFESPARVELVASLPPLDMGGQGSESKLAPETNIVAETSQPAILQPGADLPDTTNSVAANASPVGPSPAETPGVSPQALLRFFPMAGRTNAEVMVAAPVFSPPQPPAASSKATYESR